MRRILLCLLSVVIFIMLFSALGWSVIPDYPYQPVSFTKVTFTDSFWLTRMETNRTATIPFALKMCEETGRVENFKIAGGLSDKKWEGEFGFNDSDVYKVIEGASYSLMIKPDPKLDAYLDKLISYVAAAQEDNGYLYTAWTARARDHLLNIACCYNKQPWDNLKSSHELYNVGHMYEAAVAHYQATGKKSFLDVAVKNADLICEIFGQGKNEGVPGHQEIEIGLVKLYRATGNEKYLKQSRWFLSRRGQDPKQRNEYDQSHRPVLEQTEAVGHAVRATYMYSAMTDVAALTGDAAFIKAIDSIWKDVANTKLYITGGIGARHAGEAYGDAYELPNRSAYCETCAAIANVYWNYRMFLFHGDSKYVDVMERSLYNCVLSGVSMDGKKFFYPNPLESATGYERSPWFGCACCPSNICRFIASVPGYVYAVRDDAVYINLFVDSKAEFTVAGTPVGFKQITRYPWDGKIRVELSPAQTQTFVLRIRIPDWARGQFDSSALYAFAESEKTAPSFKVNGQSETMKTDKGYLCINRAWTKGDTVEIDFPMPVLRVLCDERVKEDVGKAAIQCGPIVYCVEEQDIRNGKVLNLLLARNAPLTQEWKPDLLGGIRVISGSAVELHRQKDSEVLTRSSCLFNAIPYYAWAHRDKTAMVVWLPYSEKQANPLPAPTIASQSKISASFVSNVGNNHLDFVSDQAIPKSSGDAEKGYFHWWPHKGTTEWIQYDFNKAIETGNVSVYWFDDTGRGECRIPKSWKIEYRKDGQWKMVENFSDYKISLNDFNHVSFTPVTTDALRLIITFQDNFSGGIQEWTVN